MQKPNESSTLDMSSLSRYRRARKWVYDLVQSPEIDSRLESWVRHGITILIVLNVIAVMIETMKEAYNEYHVIFHWIEIFSVAAFTVEYLLRLWAVVEDPRFSRPIRGRLRYAVSFFALVDLFAILPFYLPMLFKIDLRTIRVLRLFRLFRLMKLGRYSRAAQVIVEVFRNRREELTMSIGTIILLLIISSTVIFYLEHEAQPDSFPNIPASLWWGVVTLTTVGYGDVYPITVGGKVFAAFISILSIGLVALPSGIIVSGFVREDEEEEEKEMAAAMRERLHGKVEQEVGGGVICPHCDNYLAMNIYLSKHDTEDGE
ncbi:MAG: ion transporter [Ignavibacteriae bacterium]|nr:ion transporter [Ignavibacteriota bacterium]MCB9214322.1 ion transporter [Ignavibacteria bacterium]